MVHVCRRSPFDPFAADAYQRWRDAKMKDYPSLAEALRVEMDTPGQPTPAERAEIERLCRKTNMAVYAARSLSTPVPDPLLDPLSDKDQLKAFAGLFGLERLDANMFADDDDVSSIMAVAKSLERHSRYIPYTNRPIAWHTDGYYNPPHRQVRSMVLHCAVPAVEGGVNALLDPEILYIRLREESPDLVAALFRSDSMAIPANDDDNRSEQTGPVFSVDPENGRLHMRYTHRTRSIAWQEGEAAAAALRLRAILEAQDVPCLFQYRLEAGEGLICNNVLHTRTAFRDTPWQRRLLYRARFLERIANTGGDKDD